LVTLPARGERGVLSLARLARQHPVGRQLRTEYRIRSVQQTSSRAVPDASPETRLKEWQEALDVALRYSTRSATACQRGSDRRRRLANAAALVRVQLCGSHVVETAYTKPSIFTLLCRGPNTTMSGP